MTPIPPDETTERLRALCVTHLRPPVEFSTDGDTGTPVLVFEPPLSAAEQATYDRLLELARIQVHLTVADWLAIRARLDNLRTFRQQGQAEFMAKTAAQRDRELFDAVTDCAAVLFRMLRSN